VPKLEEKQIKKLEQEEKAEEQKIQAATIELLSRAQAAMESGDAGVVLLVITDAGMSVQSNVHPTMGITMMKMGETVLLEEFRRVSSLESTSEVKVE